MSLPRRRARFAFAVVCLAAVPVFSRTGFAQVTDDSTRNAARSLASEAKAAFSNGEFDKAHDLFHRAYTLVPAPTIAVYEGRALLKLGRLVEAEEAYMRAVRTSLDSESPEQFRQAVREAESELVAFRPRIPKVTIVPSGPGAGHHGLVVMLDGNEVNPALLGVETPVDPGDHELTATAPGGREIRQKFSLAETERKRVEIFVPTEGAQVAAVETQAASPTTEKPRVTPAEATAIRTGTSPWRMAGFAAVGAGVAGLTTGVVTGLMAAARHADAESQCPNHACVEGTDGADALDSFRSLRTLSTIGYVVGGVGLAAGVTLLLTAPSERQARSALHPLVGPRFIGVAGAF